MTDGVSRLTALAVIPQRVMLKQDSSKRGGGVVP